MTKTRSLRSPLLGAIVLAISVSLGGCQTLGALQLPASFLAGSAPTSAAEAQMQQDQMRFASTVIAGVITGYLAEIARCALESAGNGNGGKAIRKEARRCANIGALVTGVDAYVTAKKELAGREHLRATESVAADMQQDTARLRAYLASSDQVLGEGRARLASLRADLASKKLNADQAQQALGREERNLESMKKTLAEAKSTRQQYATASKQLETPQNKRNLDAELAAMDAQIKKLEKNILEYGEALEVSRG